MTSNEPIYSSKDGGWLAEDSNGIVYFFGDRSTSFESLTKKFPEYSIRKLKQKHGDVLVESADSKNIVEADAHWTAESNVALSVITADCIPILIGHPHFLCAIHAGWRGVLNEITFKSLRHLMLNFSGINECTIFIGPHITSKNFEFGLDQANQFNDLIRRYKIDPNQIFQSHIQDSTKVYIHLEALLRAQLLALGLTQSQIFAIREDTFDSEKLHSFRRDGSHTGRNISFVARRA